MKCPHANTTLGEVYLVLAITIVFTMERTLLVPIVDDTGGDDSSELGQVLHNEGVWSVKLLTLDPSII